MALKDTLKTLKLNESSISMLLGALVIVVVGVLVANYFRNQGKLTLPGSKTAEELGFDQQAGAYTVKEGDTLWSIAEDQLGDGMEWQRIAEVNNLTTPNDIETGQTLTIPGKEVALGGTETTPAPTVAGEEEVTDRLANTGEGGDTYVVVEGDSLWNIAERAYGDPYKWVEIADENNVSNPDLIYPGSQFVLPQ